MKRRGFLAGLLGLPFAAMAAKRGLSNEELKQIAEKNPPPPKWFEGDMEPPFDVTSYVQVWNTDGTVTTNSIPCTWTFAHGTGNPP